MRQLHDDVMEYLLAQGANPKIDSEDVLSFPVESTSSWRMDVTVREAEGQVIVRSVYPLPVPTDRREAVALFLTYANAGLVIGNFELDMAEGELRFKTSIEVGSSPLPEALARPLFLRNVGTFRRHVPGFEAVIDGEDPVEALAAVED